MKKLKIVLALFLCQHYFVSSQGVINNYLFGYTGPVRGTINLFSGSPVITIDTTAVMNLSYTHANISDVNGNLLFYTNGLVVMDANNDTMPNGAGLNPCPYTTSILYGGLNIPQADIIIPFPGDSSKYFLFHESYDYWSIYAASQIYYSIIDMNLNGGMGDVIQKNTSFFQDTLWGGGITACKHANGRDWWLVVPKAFYPMYHIFLISPSGVQYQSTQTIGNRWDYGQAAFSPDGSHYGIHEFRKNFQIFDFDRCIGTFSNYRFVTLNDSNWSLGFCFSPNSHLAYSSSANFLYQVNLDSSNLLSSIDTVAVWDSTYNPWFPFATGFEFMQIGPNQKIYMTTTWSTQTMHYINYPDSDGVSCEVHQHAIALPTYNGNTIPNFCNYFLGPVTGSVCDSLGLGISESIYLKNLDLKIIPNPSKGLFYINYKLPSGTTADLEIYNVLGKEVVRRKLYSYFQYLEMDGNELGEGIFLIKIRTTDDYSATGRVVLIK